MSGKKKKYIKRHAKTLKFYFLGKLMEAIHQPNEGINQKNKDRDLRNKGDKTGEPPKESQDNCYTEGHGSLGCKIPRKRSSGKKNELKF